MKRRKKRNPRPRLLDDIGRICPELKPQIQEIQPPPSGPYAPGQLFLWLCSTTSTILMIVLHLGKRLLQETVDSYLDELDRPADPVPNAQRVCPCPKCSCLVWHYNGEKKREKKFRCIFGWQTLWRYQAECAQCRATFCPLDVILGISTSFKLLPVLQSIVTFLGTHLSFREAAKVLEMTLGIHMSPETIRDVVEALGEAVIRRQENGDWEPELAKLKPIVTGAQEPLTLEVGLDGGMVPLNEKPKEESNSHKEARSATLRLKGGKGKVLAKFVFSRLTDLSVFLVSIGSLLDECRETLGIKKIVLTGDGARWIWEFGKANFVCRTVLDWYHLLGYYLALVEAARHAKSRGRRKRLGRIIDALWEGRIEDALAELQGFRCWNEAERKAKKDLVRYVENNRAHIINYQWNKHRRRTVGSGATEGSQKKAIHDRMRCSGMRWSETGADYMLAARCSELNDTAEHDLRNANLAA